MKTFRVTVNGQAFEVEVEELRQTGQPARPASAPVLFAAPPPPVPKPAPPTLTPDPPRPASGPNPGTPGTGQPVKAPMPGVVILLKVKEGDDVKEGDVLLILEAMKMENEIAAPVTGKVKQVKVSAGQSVGAGDTLVVVG